MEFNTASLFESDLADLVKANLLIWGALIVALSIILWETTFLTQVLPVVILAAIASNLILLWGVHEKHRETHA